jgi:magnesium-transporting ATPase (P-type)
MAWMCSRSSIAKSTSVPNQLTPRQGKSPLIKFLLQFKNPLILILLAASAITAVPKDPLDAAVIFGVVLINAILGCVQEAQAEQAIAALTRTMTAEAFVPIPRARIINSGYGLVPAVQSLAVGPIRSTARSTFTGDAGHLR